MNNQQEEEYRLAFEIKDAKAHVRVYAPIITPEERAKRIESLKAALDNYWRVYFEAQARKAREEARAKADLSSAI